MSDSLHEPELTLETPYAYKVLVLAQNEPTFVSQGNFIWRNAVLKSLCVGGYMNLPHCEEGRPAEACTCGIYCCMDEGHEEIHNRINTTPYPNGPATYVVKLQLFGRVIQCHTGYRAGSARIVSINVIYTSDEPPLEIAASLEAAYHVPVTLQRLRDSIYAYLATKYQLAPIQPRVAPMYLADYVKLFHSTDNGLTIPADIRATFVREYRKKLIKESRKVAKQVLDLTARSNQLDTWIEELLAYERTLISSVRNPQRS